MTGARKKTVLISLILILLGLAAGFFVYPPAWNRLADKLNGNFFLNIPQFNKPFRLGLDLQGGTHLIYEADISQVKGNPMEAMQGVRDVIERRVNLYGVAEPVVQINKVGDNYRLIVELAGVKDIAQAIKMIGETPILEFRQARDTDETQRFLEQQKAGNLDFLQQDAYFSPTPLSGKYLKRASMDFDQTTYQPTISLEFNDEGQKLLEIITEANVGKKLAIYLDGAAISAPTVREKITGGRAQITGDFTRIEAQQLVRRLNAGALPVFIKLVNQTSVGAGLGEISLKQSLQAGLIGFAAVVLFMLGRYYLNGLIAILALFIYIVLVLSIFKAIPVTLTLAGIAGFILSIGMAVDANILIFERMKEELKNGRGLSGAIDEGFKRAWPSIRDSNISSLITCVILFWLGTSIVKGFALTLAIGIIVSIFSAVTATRIFLKLFTKA